ncbi:3-oxoadipate CoA-transferase, beta subunit [Lentzea waywayandensis]|uniref:3-oxoadipate CoA-transferase, beta subunit n=1 Tax=Lentzea waywayandensis TaxID=84724 RepID=A0A1I6DMT7_9PSEU|nr:CoA-transferase [Lentzea waywayandensis]SFR06677.1 3-oxoadipate CoA-transferase, beta subunit [Lentzea waywayandensis]
MNVLSTPLEAVADTPDGATVLIGGFGRAGEPAALLESGAMDLAAGAKQVFVMMNLLTRDGKPKLLNDCTYPLTGPRCVSRVHTDLATFLITGDGVVVRDLHGISFTDLQALLDVPLKELS